MVKKLPVHLKKLKPKEREIQKALGSLPYPTFEEMRKDENGTIYAKGIVNEILYIVLRGPAAMCCYIGIPRKKYYQIGREDDYFIDVYGGVTYSAKTLQGVPRDKNIYWLGWDYGHSNDAVFFMTGNFYKLFNQNRVKWTPKNGVEHCKNACLQIRKLLDKLDGKS